MLSRMSGAMDQNTLEVGRRALAEGRWSDAASIFSGLDGPAAAEGLSDAFWWLGDVSEALSARRSAYKQWRDRGADDRAAMVAIWLAREYLGALGNDAAARGWLQRAETLGAPAGWVALVSSSLNGEPVDAAVASARESRDADLEALALARQGLERVIAGDLDAGLSSFHEAMAIATAGETSLQTLGYLCCDLALATEYWGDAEPFAQWSGVVVGIATERGHPPLVAFCATCCAVMAATDGNWEAAKGQLRAAIEMLAERGHRARCIAPKARLAELLIQQGRLEEAADLLGDRSEETLVARARLLLARGESETAAALLERALKDGDSLKTLDALVLLAEATRDPAVVARLEALPRNRKVVAATALARARVIDDAAAYEEALAVAHTPLEAAEAHLALARLRDSKEDARTAADLYESAGATARASEAASLARSLGDWTRVGPKGVGKLTKREREVLRLLAQGLTNVEIAERLYISPKTAENHVGNILMKLNVRSRTEAAAYALTHSV